MRNQKIISIGLVALVALTVLSTLLVATPVSATATIGRCPEGFVRVQVTETSADRNIDRNGDGWICWSNPPGQAQHEQSNSIYIDNIVVCTPTQVAACRVPKGPA